MPDFPACILALNEFLLARLLYVQDMTVNFSLYKMYFTNATYVYQKYFHTFKAHQNKFIFRLNLTLDYKLK